MTLPYALEHGAVVDVLRGFNDNSFDALMCDPPYGFSFMGKSWDYDVPSVALWAECLRVLKPGAPLVAFGGSRTYHRLACGIEDAGFELRDQLMWLYAKGFPKSLNISLAMDKAAGAVHEVVGTKVYSEGYVQRSTVSIGFNGSDPAADKRTVTAPSTELAQLWDGYGTALKPAHEPIVLARKPLDGTMAQNVARWGVGGLAIDACRISIDESERSIIDSRSGAGFGTGTTFSHMGRKEGERYKSHDAGRWPANLLFDEDAAAILDAEVGPRVSGLAVRTNGGGGQIMSGIGEQPYKPKPSLPNLGYMDGKTNPSRFFFCSKVSTKEREAGCEALLLKSAGQATERADLDADGERPAGLDNPRAGAGRTSGARNHHPTLKPISLTTWLARLIRGPNPGVILVPFAGAGSEMIGAVKAGWSGVFGIEREAEYVEIALARLVHWCKESEAV